uniref:Secreted protein n=1 Tax=Syphacia muris TaxID=451379 RepID=A0A0N5AA84_9BILA
MITSVTRNLINFSLPLWRLLIFLQTLGSIFFHYITPNMSLQNMYYTCNAANRVMSDYKFGNKFALNITGSFVNGTVVKVFALYHLRRRKLICDFLFTLTKMIRVCQKMDSEVICFFAVLIAFFKVFFSP